LINTINIYDDKTISGVDNIIQNGENKNLVNNSTVSPNINDNNNNISALDSEENRNTPGEEDIRAKAKLKSVDSYPLNLRTEIPNCTQKMRLFRALTLIHPY
jgi:hypothetical protein